MDAAFFMRFFLSGTFPASAFCSAAALLSRVFAAPRGRGMLVREGKTHVREGKVVGSEGREGPTGAGRCDRWGRTPGCRDRPAWRISGERVPAGPEWRPDNTNRIKNTRFGLSFNEKFGMFVHMNRIRLAEVTLIGHATGSLSGPCAGRGTGGENIWCFMSPAR